MKACKKLWAAVLGALLFACTALFAVACGGKTLYKVTLDFNAQQGTVTITESADEGGYEAGEEATVTVTPKEGFAVDAFTVNGTAQTLTSGTTYTFKVEKDTTVKATFKSTSTSTETEKFTVSIDGYNANFGKVELDPRSADGKYEKGTSVTVIVTASEGYEVASVKVNGKDVALEENKYVFTVEENTTISVEFRTAEEKEMFSVNVKKSDHGTVTFSPEGTDGKFEAGTEVTATVSPEEGYYVLQVLLDQEPVELSEDGKFTFTVDGEKEISVYYDKIREEKWEGFGTDTDPYVIETFVDKYDVKIPIVDPREASGGSEDPNGGGVQEQFPFALNVYFTYTEKTGGEYTIRSRAKNLSLAIYDENETNVFTWDTSKGKQQKFTLEANKTYTVIVGVDDFDGVANRNTPVEELDIRVSFEILAGDQTDKPLWEGTGTEQDPYVIEQFEDEYTAPINAITYFRYVATEGGKYCLSIREMFSAVITISEGTTNLAEISGNAKAFTLEQGKTYTVKVDCEYYSGEEDAVYFTIEKEPDLGNQPVDSIPSYLQGTFQSEDDPEDFIIIDEKTLIWGEKKVIVLSADLMDGIYAKVDGELWQFEFRTDEGTYYAAHPWGASDQTTYFDLYEEGPDFEIPEEILGDWANDTYSAKIEGKKISITMAPGSTLDGEVTGYDPATFTLSFTCRGLDLTAKYDPDLKTLTVDLSIVGMGQLTFTKGSAPSGGTEVPEAIRGEWKSTGEMKGETLKIEAGTYVGEGDLTDGMEGTVTYDEASKTLTFSTPYGMSFTMTYNADNNSLSGSIFGTEITFTRDGNEPAVVIPQAVLGDWKGTLDFEGSTLTLTAEKFSAKGGMLEGMEGDVLSYDAKTCTLTLSLFEQEFTVEYDAENSALIVDFTKIIGSYAIFTRDGATIPFTLPAELEGEWTGDFAGDTYKLTFTGKDVKVEVGGEEMISGEAVAYIEKAHSIVVSTEDTPFSLIYNPEAGTLQLIMVGFSVTFKKVGSETSGVVFPDAFQGVWKGTATFSWTLTITGKTLVLDNGRLPLDGTLESYDAATNTLHITVFFDPYTAVYDPESGKLTLTYDEYVIVFTKESGGTSEVVYPDSFQGVWTGTASNKTWTLTITGTTAVLEGGPYPYEGELTGYQAETSTLSLTLDGDPYTAVYNAEAGTLSLNGIVSVVLTRQNGEVSKTIPEEYLGTWRGSANNLTYEVTITAERLSYKTFDSEGKLDDLTIEDFKVDDTGIVCTHRQLGEVRFLLKDGKLEYYHGGTLTATLTKGGAATDPEGSRNNPFVWNTFVGTHEVSVEASTDAGNVYSYYAFSVTETGVYKISYEGQNNLDVLLYQDGNSNYPVAVWSLFRSSYPFSLKAGTKYVLRIGGLNEKAEFNIVAEKTELTIGEEYIGTWTDINETYTLVIAADSITLNDQKIELKDLLLADKNGGYLFTYQGKDCSVAISASEATVNRTITLEIGNESATLYKPGQFPAEGTPNNPYKLTEETLAKDYSETIGADGEVYYKITVTTTTNFTLTSDCATLSLTIESDDLSILNWEGKTEGKVFRLEGGKTYTMIANSTEEMGGKITFKLTKGGEIPQSAMIPEALRGNWVGDVKTQNTLELSETSMKYSIDLGIGIPMKGSSAVVEAKTTSTGYEISFENNYKLVYDSTTQILTLTIGVNPYTFVRAK